VSLSSTRDLLLVLTVMTRMNWLDPPAEPPGEGDDTAEAAPPKDREAPSISNLNYWAARLTPLHDPSPSYGEAQGGDAASAQGKEVIFAGCNRVGVEEGTEFVGTSCVMVVASNPSRIELVECCNASEERVMVATVT
jgi:protein N-terminal amidase